MQTSIRPQAFARGWKAVVGGMLLPAVLASGCSSAPHTTEGAVGGAAVGGIFGTLLGAAVGRPLQGAAIGAASGAALGGAAGASEDHRDKQIAQANAQAVAASVERVQQEMTQIAQMSQQHLNEQLIVNHVRQCGVAFNLSGEQLVWLKDNGVSDRVISEMQATVNYVPQPVVYTAQPGYVAPVGVGVGVGVRVR
jgi:hypothetical protein